MGDVIELPGFDQRMWMKSEASLVDELIQGGFSVEAADWVRAEWKRRMLAAGATFQKSLSITAPPGVTPEGMEFARAVVKEIGDRFHSEWLGMSAQIMLAVAELYAAKFGGSGPPPARLAEIIDFPGRPAGPPDDGKRDDD